MHKMQGEAVQSALVRRHLYSHPKIKQVRKIQRLKGSFHSWNCLIGPYPRQI